MVLRTLKRFTYRSIRRACVRACVRACASFLQLLEVNALRNINCHLSARPWFLRLLEVTFYVANI